MNLLCEIRYFCQHGIENCQHGLAEEKYAKHDCQGNTAEAIRAVFNGCNRYIFTPIFPETIEAREISSHSLPYKKARLPD
jgi:hypothetical protein